MYTKEQYERNAIDVRIEYIKKVSGILEEIDTTKSLEEQARRAFELRNKYKREYREKMCDKETAKMLDRVHPIPKWESFVRNKMKRKGMSREEALRDIIVTSTRTNEMVNKSLGL